MDQEGRFQAGAHLAFFDAEKEMLGGFRFDAKTDESGSYSVEVPAGRWNVFYLGPRTDPYIVSLRVGEVEALPRGVTPFDVLLRGSRRLTGGIRFLKHGMILKIELRRWWDREDLVASGVLLTDLGDLDRPHEDRPDEPRPDEFPLNPLRIEGLEPDEYELRLIVGRDVDANEDVYTGLRVDLSRGDADLGPVTISFQQCLDESVLRWQAGN